MRTLLCTQVSQFSMSRECDIVCFEGNIDSWSELPVDTMTRPFTMSLMITCNFESVIKQFYECVLRRLVRSTYPCVLFLTYHNLVSPRVPEPVLQQLITHPLIKHTYFSYRKTNYPNTSSLPIGFDPQKLNDGMVDVYLKYAITRSASSTRNAELVCLFNVRVKEKKNWKEQSHIRGLCETVWSEFAEVRSFKRRTSSMTHVDMLRELDTFGFITCVHGCDATSPGIFECLSMGCIPIVKRSAMDDAYEGMPILYVDDWKPECLNESILRERHCELAPFFDDDALYKTWSHKLRTSYWVDQVQSHFD